MNDNDKMEMKYSKWMRCCIQMYHDNNVNRALFNVTTNGFFVKQQTAKIVVNTNCIVHG